MKSKFEMMIKSRLIFTDESGFTPNWTSKIKDQPYFVLAAISIPIEVYPLLCKKLRKDLERISQIQNAQTIGKTSEIKAKDIISGRGIWNRHPEDREQVRKIFLASPRRFKGNSYAVIIDKKKLKSRYSSPDDPYSLAFKFIFERVQQDLQRESRMGYFIHDQTKLFDDKHHEHSSELRSQGSTINVPTQFEPYIVDIAMDNIAEFYLGKSTCSIGLQLADFYASHIYNYFRNNKPEAASIQYQDF